MATFTVTTTNDSGAGSLRQAIADANATAGLDTILFSVSGTVTLTSGQLTITDDLIVDGDLGVSAGAGIVLDGNASGRVFEIGGLVDVTLSHLTVTNGAAETRGGGILNAGSLTLDRVTVTGNAVTDTGAAEALWGGGGLYNEAGARLSLQDSTVSGNSAGSHAGGGIFSGEDSYLRIAGSTLSGNLSGDVGGALRTLGDGAVVNSTISGNTAAGGPGGGVFHSGGRLDITQSTVADNSAASGTASGLVVASSGTPASASLVHSIFQEAETTIATQGGPAAAIIADAGNLFSDSPAHAGASDLTETDARLGALGDNGGPTATHALLSGSPAINAGQSAIFVTEDQRGVARDDGATDIGAFEALASAAVSATVTGITDPDGSSDPSGLVNEAGDAVGVLFTVTNSGAVALSGVELAAPLFDGPGGSLEAPVESLTADGVLEIGETWSYTGSYMVAQSVLDGAGVDAAGNRDGDYDIDIAAELGTAEGVSATAQPVSVALAYRPVLEVDKTVVSVTNPDGSIDANGVADEAGDAVTYALVARNAGAVTLTGVSLSDPFLGGTLASGETLAPGTALTRTAQYTVTASDLSDNGLVDGVSDGRITHTGMADSDQTGPVSAVAEVPLICAPLVTDNTGRPGTGNFSAAWNSVLGVWTGGTPGSDNGDFDQTPGVNKGRGSGGDDQIKGNDAANVISGESGKDFLRGDAGDDSLYGGTDNDILMGGVTLCPNDDAYGNDLLMGNGGNDMLAGQGGNDSLFGGADDDMLLGGPGRDTLDGATGDDLLFGGLGDDRLRGDGGADWLAGQDGNDRLDASTGNDTVSGGDGNDTLYGHGDADLLAGNRGSDYLVGGGGADTVLGGFSADHLRGGDGDDMLDGGLHDDVVQGDRGRDTIFGGRGNDYLRGGADRDVMDGGDDDDILEGGDNADQLQGGSNDDRIWGDNADGDEAVGGAADTIDGGFGHDWIDGGEDGDAIVGGHGEDTLLGGSGNDTIEGNEDDDSIEGGDGNDQVSGGDGNDDLNGRDGDDVLIGDAGEDTLKGSLGDDCLSGGAGNDRLFGHAGNDRIAGDGAPAGGEGDDFIDGGQGHDSLYGGGGNDTIHGDRDLVNGGRDTLRGGAGDDSLSGGTDSDRLLDEAGNDTMTGGSGGDDFVFGFYVDGNADGDRDDPEDYYVAPSGDTVITDFDDDNSDRLVLDSTIDPDRLSAVIAANGADVILTIAPSSGSAAPATSITLEGLVNELDGIDPSDTFFNPDNLMSALLPEGTGNIEDGPGIIAFRDTLVTEIRCSVDAAARFEMPAMVVPEPVQRPLFDDTAGSATISTTRRFIAELYLDDDANVSWRDPVLDGAPEGPALLQFAAVAERAPVLDVSAPADFVEAPDAAGQRLVQSGVVAFDDVDPNDLVSVRTVPGTPPVRSGGTLPAELSAALVAGFSTGGVDVAAPGSVPWSYDATASLDFLAAGETITFDYTVIATNRDGAYTTAPIRFTITGTNDAPTLSATPGTGFVEDADAAAQGLFDTGLVQFDDVDPGDLVEIGFAAVGVRSQGGPLPDASVQSALLAGFSIEAMTAAAPGSVSWTYSAAADLDGLSAGQTVTLGYAITATDRFGARTTIPFELTITGSNDGPVVTSAPAAAQGFVTEAGQDETGAVVVAGTPVASGTLEASDMDGGPAPVWTGDAIGAYGTLTITDTGRWRYVLDQSAADALDLGDTVTESFVVSVTDNHGATATETVTVSITGSNDSPTITTAPGEDAGTVVEAGRDATGIVTPGLAAASGQLAASDADADAALTWTGAAIGAYGAFTITETGAWHYALDQLAANGLDATDSVTETFAATVTDEYGATATEQVSITITGAYDAPLFSDAANTVDFGTLAAWTYESGSQYDALGGDDRVSLPDDTGAATVAGFDPARAFAAGDGQDTVLGGGLEDTILGGAGDDEIDGGAGDDSLDGGAGDDLLHSGDGSDTMTGGDGDDTLVVTAKTGPFSDSVDGGADSDTLVIDVGAAGGVEDFATRSYSAGIAEGGTFLFDDGAGGQIGFEHIETLAVGGADYEIILQFGSSGVRDDIFNVNGRVAGVFYDASANIAATFDNGIASNLDVNTLRWAYGGDPLDPLAIFGSEARDIVVSDASAGPMTIATGGGDDEISLHASPGLDQVDAGAGDDLLVLDLAMLGADGTHDGGAGDDTLSFGHRGGGTAGIMDLSALAVTDFENVVGSGGDDTVIGDGAANRLYGGRGNDAVQGGAGDDALFGGIDTAGLPFSAHFGQDDGSGADTLDGGAGADTLTGGGGADVFVLRAGDGGATPEAADTFTDFADGVDLLALADGLATSDLSIVQGTGLLASDTVIRHSLTGEYLAIVEDTQASAIDGLDFI